MNKGPISSLLHWCNSHTPSTPPMAKSEGRLSENSYKLLLSQSLCFL